MPDPRRLSHELECYLVGGAVRDRLLGNESKDRDWVVVGAKPDEMIERGFKPVGRDFPVFLHPRTHEEYALARTERKTAPGYKGFEAHASPEVTLVEDLERRDLTINAMALDARGNLVDPFHGKRDLDDRVLRHVSAAFAEDPLRVLRVARFTARYGDLGFTVAAETLALMRAIVARGEMEALVAERVWQELHGALGEPRPDLFVSTLRDCGALARLVPELDALFGVPQPEQYHPEIDTGAHVLLAMRASARLSRRADVRFAVMLHDLGKGLTPGRLLPSHHGHEEAGLAPVETVCKRLRAPARFRTLALAVCRYHLKLHRLEELKPRTVLELLTGLDAFRNPDRLEPFVLACEADSRGRKGCEDRPYPQARLLNDYLEAARRVDLSDLAGRASAPRKIEEEVRRRRIAAMRKVRAAAADAAGPCPPIIPNRR